MRGALPESVAVRHSAGRGAGCGQVALLPHAQLIRRDAVGAARAHDAVSTSTALALAPPAIRVVAPLAPPVPPAGALEAPAEALDEGAGPLGRVLPDAARDGARVARRRGPGQEKGEKFPTLEARISIVFHSIWLIFGRAIISRSALDEWMLKRT